MALLRCCGWDTFRRLCSTCCVCLKKQGRVESIPGGQQPLGEAHAGRGGANTPGLQRAAELSPQRCARGAYRTRKWRTARDYLFVCVFIMVAAQLFYISGARGGVGWLFSVWQMHAAVQGCHCDVFVALFVETRGIFWDRSKLVPDPDGINVESIWYRNIIVRGVTIAPHTPTMAGGLATIDVQ